MDALMLSVERVAELEQTIAAAGTSLATLMERAGTAVAEAARRAVPERASAAVLAGSGNNGGDGWVAARELAQAGYEVTIACTKAPGDLRAEPARSTALAAEAWAARAHKGGAESEGQLHIIAAPSEADVIAACGQASIIVDALLGTGFSGVELRAPLDAWVQAMNAAREEYGAYVIAADVPSGLSAQTGIAAKPTVRADETVTMLAVKPGLVAPGAEEYVGELTCATLGVNVAREFPEFG